jgi:PAS domain S-box-containing protein/putative nucleotidyltransferase with HDIG domain
MERARIMVVEDEAVISLEIQDRLKQMGHSVCGTAVTGADAIKTASDERPDLILMDVQLRGAMDGVEAATEIRSRLDTPVIFLTAFADNQTVERARMTEPFGYLIKPFSEKELFAAIEVALYKHATEAKLKESERRYATTLRCIADCVIVADPNMNITLMNPAAQAITGWKQEEAYGKKVDEVLSLRDEKTSARVESPMAEAMRERVSVQMSEPVVLVAKDGRRTPVEDSAAPLVADGGMVTGAVMVFRDVTERKAAEERLRVVLESLEERVKEQTAELRLSFGRLERAMEGTIHAVATMVEARDRYTAGHQLRVTDLACAIAQEMGISEEQMTAVRIAALIHDVGKVCIPTEILNKPSQLSPIEFEIVKQHPKAAYDVLQKIEFPYPVADIVLQHHERIDGSGYPAGLRGDQIRQEAKIIAVSDVVEAMSSHRPYRAALGADKALQEIHKNRGILYDPDVVDACLRVFQQAGFKFKDPQSVM